MRRWSARSALPASLPRPPSLLSLLEVLADDVEEPLPASPLTFYPIGGLGKRIRAERQAMGPSVNHSGDHTGLLEHLQVPRYGRLRDAEVPGHLADGGHAAAEALDDVAAKRVREGFERIVSHFANYIRVWRSRRVEGMTDDGAPDRDPRSMADREPRARPGREGVRPRRR